MDAFVIDAFEFCRLKEARQGEFTVADFPRLANESVGRAGAVRWSLRGGSSCQGHPQLTLSVSGGVKLVCQRCLMPFAFDIESESVLVLARDEGEAGEIDALLADESVDVIVGSREFNIAELIEDDALLMMPLSPRHENCPDQLVPQASKDAEKVSPFAVLKNLKR